MTRKEFLRLAACASTGLLFNGARLAGRAGRASSQTSGSDDRIARISGVVAEYDSQGIHRTATDVDNRSAEWLAREVRQAGVDRIDAFLEAFDLNRVDVRSAYVESDGRRVDGLPFFDGTFTDARGIVAKIGAPDAKLPLALVTLTAANISSEGQSIAELRRSPDLRGIVAITRGAHAGLSPSNAISFASPYGVPVLQVSSDEAAWLAEQVRLQRDVRFVAEATRTPARANNVVATIRGRQPDLSPVVVMTPRSGWWQCASERGGGLACWLEIARAAAATSRRPMLLVASSGHELGHYGLDAFIDRRPGLIRNAAAWIHLGANIGAAGGAARLQASDDEIEGMANRGLMAAGAVVQQRVPRGTVPGGEARNIHTGGGRYISLLGSGPRFHSPADRWPDAVDVPAVARFAAAFVNVVAALDEG
jgi:hypothetical protein